MVRRFLVVANQTLGGAQFTEAVKERVAASESEFYVVVPATAVSDQVAVPYGGDTGPTKTPSPGEHAHAIAEQRLAVALGEIRAAGGEADGQVGASDPLDAVRDAVGREKVDEIIISTLPLGLSKWLRRDLPRQVERLTGLPVTHITGKEPGR